MKTLKFISLMLMAAGISGLIACSSSDSDGGSSGGGGGTSSEPGMYVSLNPSNPMLLKMANSKGEEAILLGTKTSSGPSKVEQMLVKNSGETEFTQFFYNDSKQIEKIIAPNGVVMQFEWLSKTKTALTMIEPNTNEQLNTVVDFENNEYEYSAPNINYDANKRSGEATMTLEPLKDQEITPVQGMELTRASSFSFTGDIYVEACGAPSDGDVYVDVWDWIEVNDFGNKGNYRDRFKCVRAEKGHYQFTIPSNYYNKIDVHQYADKINKIISEICFYNSFTAPGSGAKELLCTAVGAIITFKGIGLSAPVAGAFTKACLTATISLDTMCTLVSGNLPDYTAGAPSVTDRLLEILKEEQENWVRLFVQPWVDALPSAKKGNSQVIKDGGKWTPTTISFGGSPSINSFTLNPPAPSHGVSYKAIANLFCLPEGTKVVMNIVGTDGYSNSQTSTVSAKDAGGTFTATLTVPGAASGVKDVCTVTVTTPSGETITKKASLVFQ